MENSEQPNPNPNNHNHHSPNADAEQDQNDFTDGEEEEEDDGEDEYENDVVSQPPLARLQEQRFKLETLSRRLSSELVPIRVHDVVIRGNAKTKEWVIEAELKGIEDAATMQDLIRASEVALARLQGLGIFDSTNVRLEPGPPELPHTANVVVDVVEAANRVSGEFGVYTKPSVRSCFLYIYIFFHLCC